MVRRPIATYLKGDVVVSKANFKLLSPVLVLLRPLRVVFPGLCKSPLQSLDSIALCLLDNLA